MSLRRGNLWEKPKNDSGEARNVEVTQISRNIKVNTFIDIWPTIEGFVGHLSESYKIGEKKAAMVAKPALPESYELVVFY